MKVFDYDIRLQNQFDKYFSGITKKNWRKWLDISSKEDFEDECLSNSGLSMDVLEKIKNIKTNPRDISIDSKMVLEPERNLEKINNLTKERLIIATHTSGTSGGNLESLKWYHFTKDLIKRLWAPGMQAIFESSLLDRDSSAIIYLPSRIKFDGLLEIENRKLVRLYSSEFSQRLVISLIKPKSYLIDEYKNSVDLSTITKMLSMEDVSVLSAPASTILRWADPKKLTKALSSQKYGESEVNEELSSSKEIYQLIKNHNIEKSTKLIQNKLSELLNNTTLIMSTTSLKEKDWRMISKFLNKEKEKIRFTSLYVGSEVGPFAASIDHSQENKNKLIVFPLTLPVIERKGNKEIISRCNNKFGNLMISRMGEQPIINLDIGDIVFIEEKEGIPKISERIMRSGFKLKSEYEINGYHGDYDVYTGDYFNFNDFEIVDPRSIISCLNKRIDTELNKENPLIIIDGNPNKLIIPNNQKSSSKKNFKDIFINCSSSEQIKTAFNNSKLEIEFHSIKLTPKQEHSDLLSRVRKGQLPKGILKKWQFYVLRSKN
ncbi:MAG: hypothetical protein GF329_02275 [Candidatus Lokiarchaeota archaeon]|nr:hypothetical protein [Candidatus Lokiarchaeota archaeon]